MMGRSEVDELDALDLAAIWPGQAWLLCTPQQVVRASERSGGRRLEGGD